MARACVSPPELNARALLAYIDDRADQQVVMHLERCPYCREKAQHLACLQDRMTAQLYRLSCPPTIELGEYYLGLLPGEQAEAVARHLSECPHCTREVAQLKEYMTELAPILELGPLERIKERARVLIARLVGGGLEDVQPGHPVLAPAYAGVRGEEEGPHLYQADAIQVIVEVQDDAEQPDRKAILGLIVGMEPGGLEAHLWQAERRVAVISVDELGNFVIPNLAPGSYELILSGPKVEVHIQELQIGTS